MLAADVECRAPMLDTPFPSLSLSADHRPVKGREGGTRKTRVDGKKGRKPTFLIALYSSANLMLLFLFTIFRCRIYPLPSSPLPLFSRLSFFSVAKITVANFTVVLFSYFSIVRCRIYLFPNFRCPFIWLTFFRCLFQLLLFLLPLFPCVETTAPDEW